MVFFIMDLGHWDFLLLLGGHSSSCKYNFHISTQLDLQQKHNNDVKIQSHEKNTKVHARIQNKPED